MFEKKIDVNGIKTNYKIAGSGPAILILHGWGASSDSWLKVQEILAGKGYKIIVPDFPGFGKSDNPPEAWGVGDYSEWLKGFIDKVIGERVFLVGHSFGGRGAIRFVNRYPDRVKKLILCASAGIRPKLTLKQKLFSWLVKIATKQKRVEDGPKPVLLKRVFYSILGQKDYYQAKGIMKETFKKIIEENLLPELSQIKVKTLILWGKEDKLVPVKYAFVFQEQIKNSQLKIFPDAGHSPHLEIPEELSKEIITFLENKGV